MGAHVQHKVDNVFDLSSEGIDNLQIFHSRQTRTNTFIVAVFLFNRDKLLSFNSVTYVRIKRFLNRSLQNWIRRHGLRVTYTFGPQVIAVK